MFYWLFVSDFGRDISRPSHQQRWLPSGTASLAAGNNSLSQTWHQFSSVLPCSDAEQNWSQVYRNGTCFQSNYFQIFRFKMLICILLYEMIRKHFHVIWTQEYSLEHIYHLFKQSKCDRSAYADKIVSLFLLLLTLQQVLLWQLWHVLRQAECPRSLQAIHRLNTLIDLDTWISLMWFPDIGIGITLSTWNKDLASATSDFETDFNIDTKSFFHCF